MTPIFLIQCLVFCLAGLVLEGQSLSITIDDAPNLDHSPMLLGAERNMRLLEAFREKGIRVALFANGIRGGDTPVGRQWLELWGREGHRIGNHTYGHLNLSEVGVARFKEDSLKEDVLLRGTPGYWPMLRFPFLQRGKTIKERLEAQEMLKAEGYAVASVSIPTYDWLWNAKLYKLLEANPDADITPLKSHYLKHLEDMLTGYRELGRALLGRDPAHTILLHHNLLNALLMPEVLQMLEMKGWKVVAPETAYQDAIYREDVTTVGFSESHLGAIARKRGVLLEEVRRLEAKYASETKMLKDYPL